MNVKETQELRELRDRLIKLETMLELEFKHMKEDWKLVCASINKLNEEYGQLLQKQADLERKNSTLEAKFDESITHWKLAATVISPLITALIVLGIQHIVEILL